MDHNSLKDLLEKYDAGVCSTAEKQLLESWYLSEGNAAVDKPINAEHLAAANAVIWKGVLQNIDPQKSAGRFFRLWPRIVGIAATVAFIAIGAYFYSKPGITETNDVAPGRNIAVLTLANGKKIALSDTKTGVVIGNDKLAYDDGSLVQYSSGSHFSGSLKGDQKNTGPVGASSLGIKNQMLTASTPRGGTYQVILPDGTHVWLNAASSLSFPSKFTGGIRTVDLIGEAYFEVIKDRVHPFVVRSGGQNVEVLGTHFNINCYTDEPGVKTTLLEGSVRVNNKTMLKPGQQSIWDGEVVKVGNADLEADLAWKEGDFIFNGEKLESIMRKVSRWYDVEVVYAKGAPTDFVLGGYISRSKPISAILELLGKTGKIKYKINGRIVTIMP